MSDDVLWFGSHVGTTFLERCKPMIGSVIVGDRCYQRAA